MAQSSSHVSFACLQMPDELSALIQGIVRERVRRNWPLVLAFEIRSGRRELQHGEFVAVMRYVQPEHAAKLLLEQQVRRTTRARGRLGECDDGPPAEQPDLRARARKRARAYEARGRYTEGVSGCGTGDTAIRRGKESRTAAWRSRARAASEQPARKAGQAERPAVELQSAEHWEPEPRAGWRPERERCRRRCDHSARRQSHRLPSSSPSYRTR